MTETTSNPRKVRTPPFRISFPALFEPRKQSEDSTKLTFQLSQLYPPGSDLKGLKAAMKAAMIEKFGPDTEKWPKLRRGPADVIRDAKDYSDERVKRGKKPLAGYEKGWLFARANAQENYPPTIVGPTKGSDGKFPVITDKREVYAGRWARATLEAFVYERKDGIGITFGLLNVQLLKHDAHLGGAVSDPNADFDNASEEWAGEGDDWENGAAPDKAAGAAGAQENKPAEKSPWD